MRIMFAVRSSGGEGIGPSSAAKSTHVSTGCASAAIRSLLTGGGGAFFDAERPTEAKYHINAATATAAIDISANMAVGADRLSGLARRRPGMGGSDASAVRSSGMKLLLRV